jgi:spore coat polysaccharide biosynthesis protein SpsF (cytidylyltransferase family)
VVAIPHIDVKLQLCLMDNGITFSCGSEDDVLDRYYQAAYLNGADHIVRLTADCPLIDPNVIDAAVDGHLRWEADYSSNVNPPELPDGMDVEVFTFSMLEEAWRESKEREHVTTWMVANTEEASTNADRPMYTDIRLTVDYIEDYQAVRTIWDAMPENFTLFHILRYLREHPEVREINSLYKRNTKEGA